MTYAWAFRFIAVCLCVLALANRGIWWLLLWPSLSFAFVGMAYGTANMRLLGKRPDGTIGIATFTLLLPYFAYTWAIWHLLLLFSREPASTEVIPGLWLGRRPFTVVIPSDIDLIVDLTAEFYERQNTMKGRTYLCFPTLDGEIMAIDQMREAVERLAAHEGHALVHCAQGHGRSAALVAAVLLRKGICSSAEAAEAFIQKSRPGVRLNSKQRAQIKEFEPAMRQPTK